MNWTVTVLVASLLIIPQEVSREIETVRQKDLKRHPGVEYGAFNIHVLKLDNGGIGSLRALMIEIEVTNQDSETRDFDAGALAFVDKEGRQISAREPSFKFLSGSEWYLGEPVSIHPGAKQKFKVPFTGSLYLDKNIPTKLFYGDDLILRIIK